MDLSVKIFKQHTVSKIINLKGLDDDYVLKIYPKKIKQDLKPLIISIYNELWLKIDNPTILLKASITGWIRVSENKSIYY